MSIDSIKSYIETIKEKCEELNTINELEEAEELIEEIGKKIEQAEGEINEIHEDSSLSKPLLSSLSCEEKDLKIYSKKFEKLKNIWERKRMEADLKEGKLTAVDAIKAQRNMALDNNREVDNHGLIIDSIGENIKTANVNLNNINTELQNQGDQMNRIQEKTLDTEKKVKDTGKIMTRMEGRAKCVQIITFFAVIIFGIFDVVLIAYLVYKKFIAK